jgi:hypothetical protein
MQPTRCTILFQHWAMKNHIFPISLTFLIQHPPQNYYSYFCTNTHKKAPILKSRGHPKRYHFKCDASLSISQWFLLCGQAWNSLDFMEKFMFTKYILLLRLSKLFFFPFFSVGAFQNSCSIFLGFALEKCFFSKWIVERQVLTMFIAACRSFSQIEFSWTKKEERILHSALES